VLILLIKRLQFGSSRDASLRRLAQEVLLLAIPLLICMTVLAHRGVWTLSLLTMLCAASIWFTSSQIVLVRSGNDEHEQKQHQHQKDGTLEDEEDDDEEEVLRRPCLTLFKSTNTLLTCMAILAVDFPVFPRRSAKTETFGISLMDIGVGSFIVSSAVTSKFARQLASKAQQQQQQQQQQQIRAKEDEEQGSKRAHIWSSFAPSPQRLVVLLLGVGRLVVLKLVDYQEHTSEYGLHWNFFVTLFCVWCGADAMHTLVFAILPLAHNLPPLPSSWPCLASLIQALLSIFVLLIYQALLSHTSLTTYIFTAPRTDFFSSNREGILSLFGYLPLYLLAEALSQALFFDHAEQRGKRALGLKCTAAPSKGKTLSFAGLTFWPRAKSQRLVAKLICVSGILWLAWFAASTWQATSRRLANLAFIALTLALSFSLIMLMAIADELGGASRAGPIASLELINAFPLTTFMFANLLTGAVNKSLNTIHASAQAALLILSAYSIAVISSARVAGYLRGATPT